MPASKQHARVKTPTVLQMEAVECGSTSLSIILSYHGRFETLETLRAACGVSRDGSKASNLVKAARRYGLSAKGYKKEPADLRRLPPPYIVFWNFNHFLVVEGFGKNLVYLNDPASGPRTVSDEEFDQSFTGVVIVFEKTPEFKAGGSRPGVLELLARKLRGNRSTLVYLVLAGVALVIPGLVLPVISRVYVDYYMVGGMKSWVPPLLTAMCACAALIAALFYLQQSIIARLETRLAVSGSGSFFWRLLQLPMEFYSQRYAGDIAHRVGINDRLASLMGGELATNLVGVIVTGLFVALMLQYDVTLTLVGVGIAALNLVALRSASRGRADQRMRLMQERGKLMGVAMDGLASIESLKASGAESDFFNKWGGHYSKVANAEQEFLARSQFVNAVPGLLGSLNMAAILCIGGMRVMDGVLTAGMLIAFQALMTSLLNPVNKLVALGGQLQEVQADLTRLHDVMENAKAPEFVREPADQPSAGTAERLNGHVELRNVTFGYSKLEAPLVTDFCLTIPAGSRVALVGGSGSGKSTISKLVSGLYEPWAGEILFDGRPRATIPRATLNNSLALVDQDIVLFEGTIRDNIAMWDDTLDESTVVEAAQDAVIHDDIANRRDGYNAAVEERGRNFSGGQRQRIEIARALAMRPRVLILDEATAALDPRTERLIEDNLRRRGCTCLVVAHRLSTIRDCDEIVVLERGKVVERGVHQSLIERGGAYASLVFAQ